MPLTLRRTKGSRLTSDELDDNLVGLSDGSFFDDVSSEDVGFLPSGTGAIAETVQTALRRLVSDAQYSTGGNYDTAKVLLTGKMAIPSIEVVAGGNVRLQMAAHQNTNYITGDGSAGGAIQIYSQIIADNDIVLAVSGAADLHVGNVAGGTGVFFIDMNIKVSAWLNGTRGHGLQITQQDDSVVMEFPSSGGIIEVPGVIRGGNGANDDLVLRNGSAAGIFNWQNAGNTINLMTLSDGGLLKLAAVAGTPSIALLPGSDAARIKGGGSASGIIFYPNQTGTGTGGFFRFNNNSTDDQIHFAVLATAGVASVNYLQAKGAASGANASLVPSAENLLLGSGSALATTATAGYVMLPSCAGTPTGVPTGQAAGNIPMIFDTTGVKLWFYTGGSWKGVVVA